MKREATNEYEINKMPFLIISILHSSAVLIAATAPTCFSVCYYLQVSFVAIVFQLLFHAFFKENLQNLQSPQQPLQVILVWSCANPSYWFGN